MKPHKANKYSLFKSNRSQASLLSNQSFQERASFQASPIESPLHSPAFPPPSAASSPLSPDDKDKDDALARKYEVDAASFHQVHQSKPNVLQRSQSQRSTPSPRATFGPGPTINLVSPTQSSVGGSPTIAEDPDSQTPDFQQPPQAAQNLKKKRHFFGIGKDSSNAKEVIPIATPIPPRGLARSVSARKTAPEPSSSTETGNDHSQQHWPSSTKLPSPVGDDDLQDTYALHPNNPYGNHSSNTPPIPPKDPPRSPLFLPSSAQDHRHNDAQPPSPNTAPSQSQATDQLGAKPPAWDRVGRPSNHHRAISSETQPQYQAFQPVPSSSSSTSSHPLQSRSTQDLAFPQPPFSQNSRPSSRQSYEPPSPSHSLQLPFHQRNASLHTPQHYSEGSMGPPATQQQHPPGGRSIESAQQNTHPGLVRESSNYTAYSQGAQGQTQSGQSTGQYGSQLGVTNNQQAGGSYRNTPQASPMVQQNSNSEQGRNTPPPSRSRDDLSGLDVQQLLARHDELNDKYRKVKKYYFDKDAQVQQLQNTLAHQRLSQSRTSLDDNEYMTRFNRLDGAINNLAFNIRKDWRVVPPWLAGCVNREATATGKQEMTAVGRACISRWIVEELLDRYFHPALEPNLSCQLKIIEKNLRRFAPPTPTEEEREALLAKISNWRLATVDGLADMLGSPEAGEYRAHLTELLVKMLVQDLMDNLKEPAPLGLEAGVIGIVELAVGIAANVPLESRDVFINYVMPGTLVHDAYMTREGVLPALTNPGDGISDTNSIASTDDKEETDRESLKDMSLQQQQAQQHQQQQKKKPGMLSGLMGKKPVSTAATPGSSRSGASSAAEGAPQPPKEERVRFAAFMSVEVRGKNMLVKAPVFV
ncbi:hypothetical protein MMC13_004852 [Lambiella insularis]|nr:hypothetical protein [Lambiella insularis]